MTTATLELTRSGNHYLCNDGTLRSLDEVIEVLENIFECNFMADGPPVKAVISG